MARIPFITPNDVPAAERPAFDRFIQKRGGIIDGIREKRALSALDPDEQAAVDFTQELLRARKVSRATFDSATARFGQRGTLALTNLVACYAVLAYNMNTYELAAPVHATEKALPG